jgi:hypothetical protein
VVVVVQQTIAMGVVAVVAQVDLELQHYQLLQAHHTQLQLVPVVLAV